MYFSFRDELTVRTGRKYPKFSFIIGNFYASLIQGHLRLKKGLSVKIGAKPIFFIAVLGGSQPYQVLTYEINGTGTPRMAQTFAILSSVNRILFAVSYGGIVFFPERSCPLREHASPIAFD